MSFMPRIASAWILVSLVLLVLAAGCGGKPVPIHFAGEVKLNGSPLPKATVQFFPIDDKGNVRATVITAIGETDSAGKFTLTTPNEGSGVLPGTYKVTVVAASTGAFTEEQKKFPGASVNVQVKQLVAPEFADANKTPLKVTVPGGPNVLEVSGPVK